MLRGLKPCVIGVVLATGIYMVFNSCLGSLLAIAVQPRAVLLTAILAASFPVYRRFTGKKLSPILLIVISGAAGIAVYGG